MEITYELIKPIIFSEVLEGNQVKLQFKANNQEQPIETLGMIMASQEEIMKNVAKQMAIQGAKNMAVNTAGDALGSLVGGAGGSMVASAARTAGSMAVETTQDPMAMIQTEITPEKQQKAVLDAFAGLQAYYKFNDSTNEWEYISPA